MYSFSQRPDTTCIDEPLYGSWLQRNTDIYRPYREELLSVTECNSTAAMEALFERVLLDEGRVKGRVVFAKHIAKQLVGDNIDMKYFRDGYKGVKVRHIFLIRDPLEMILSWSDKNTIHQEKCTLESLSLPLMMKLFSEFKEDSINKPIVIESKLLKSSSRDILIEVCSRLGLPFYENQLNWTAGPKPEVDGMWAKFWYDQVHMSTGFAENSHSMTGGRKYKCPLSLDQLDLYREALPFYEFLKRQAVGIDPLHPNSSLMSCHGDSLSLLADVRNANLLAFIGNSYYPRELAKVSVFDSAVQGGDAVWEGLRIYKGTVFKLKEHVARLIDSARAMMFQNIPSEDFIVEAVLRTLQINGMLDNAHIRLTLTRGVKTTSSMNPKFNMSGCTLIILPEFKTVGDPTTYNNNTGITLITASTRRNGPQFLDSKIHHCNLINNILAKIQANNASAADALMLDNDGFVSETNATNIFMIKNGKIFTPTADSCLPGITRQCVIDLVKEMTGNVVIEKRLSLTEFYTADEVFTTGTMGELSPVIQIDGRITGNGGVGPLTKAISASYQELTKTIGVPIY